MNAVAENNLKKTPLHDRHVSLNGKMVDFAGWSLPIYYTSILAEHQWTRQACSFFDVSHLGEIRVHGPGAFDFLQKRLTNDLRKVSDGRMLYSLICDEQGRTLDDILIYRQSQKDFYLIVNASNIDVNVRELYKYADDSVVIENHSDTMSCIAIQGPKAESMMSQLFAFDVKHMEYYSFLTQQFLGEPVWISRSGYTGEDGFEIFSSNEKSPLIWDRLSQEGKKYGVLPAGLGARNTLRLEAGNALYGHEITPTTLPFEAGLGFAVSLEKGDFVGRGPIVAQKEKGLSRKLVAFKVMDKAVARDGYPVFDGDKKIGYVTSGSFGPSVGCGIGLAYVEKGFDAIGTRITIEIHSRKAPAEIVKRPFVEHKHKRKG